MKRLAWPLACYLGMTVVVPLLHGAAFDVEHALTVGIAVAVLLAAVSGFKNFRRLS